VQSFNEIKGCEIRDFFLEDLEVPNFCSKSIGESLKYAPKLKNQELTHSNPTFSTLSQIVQRYPT
jgi:hypothetical protein